MALSLRAAFYAAFLAALPMPWPVTCCAFYEVFLTGYIYFDVFFIYTWQVHVRSSRLAKLFSKVMRPLGSVHI